MATFAPTRPVPAGAFLPICRCCQSWAIVVPFGPHYIGPLLVVGHENLGRHVRAFFHCICSRLLWRIPGGVLPCVFSSIIGCEQTARGLSRPVNCCPLRTVSGALRLRPAAVSTNSAQCFIWLTFADIVGHYCSAAAPVFSRVTLF